MPLQGRKMKYETLSTAYKDFDTDAEAPQEFIEYCAAAGNLDPNTCAVRLSSALLAADSTFFKGQLDGVLAWEGRPTKAAELAIILNKKFGAAKLVKKPDVNGKKGILFFDTITGSTVTGHISTWTGTAVGDTGGYFDSCPRVYFWELE